MNRTGTLAVVGGRSVLRFERRYPHPVEKVWRAITEPAHLSRWFPTDMRMELQLGAKIRFVSRERQPEEETGGEITALDPPRLFEFTWVDDVLRWELPADGGGCLRRSSSRPGPSDTRSTSSASASTRRPCLNAASLPGCRSCVCGSHRARGRRHPRRAVGRGTSDGSARCAPRRRSRTSMWSRLRSCCTAASEIRTPSSRRVAEAWAILGSSRRPDA